MPESFNLAMPTAESVRGLRVIKVHHWVSGADKIRALFQSMHVREPDVEEQVAVPRSSRAACEKAFQLHVLIRLQYKGESAIPRPGTTWRLLARQLEDG